MCASSPAAAAAPLLPLQVGQEEQPCMFQDVLIFTFGVFAACDCDRARAAPLGFPECAVRCFK